VTGLVWALPLIPAAAGLAGLLIPLRHRRAAALLAVAAAALALTCAVTLFATATSVTDATRLADFGDITVEAAVRWQPVTGAVAIAVTLVALLVQLYSIAYLDNDSRYAPYAAQVGLFTAAMLLVVIADDLVLMLIGWEVMGACSYLLIGHDRRLPQAPAAAVKAFLVTRVGDVGFLLGVVLLGTSAGTFNITTLLAKAPTLDTTTLTAATVLILAGAVGKSAQFPLHTWLPDAMAGPTPVSALIHAATMVAAGAYVLVRLLPMYALVPDVQTVIAVIAAVTMLLAGCAALAADDLKRVLAWSTVSQVAFMFGGVAVSAADATLFHLLSHAGFKALLFLCAGAVIHLVASNSMETMGGLRRGAPVVFWTMTAGFAALAGIPPLSGFWSKESILGAAVASGTVAGAIVWWAGLLTVALTAGYATRAWLRTFLGARRRDLAPHDPPALMRWPLLVLAVPTILLGVAGVAGPLRDLPALHVATTAIVLLAAVAGALPVYLVWRTDTAADPARMLGPLHALFAHAFYLDQAQRLLVVRPIRALASVVRRGDEGIVDGAVEGSGGITVHLARRLMRGHSAGVPRHLFTALAGVVVLGALGVAAFLGMLT
jgi:NADH-quinone oxidoreductase subunit L